MCPSMTRCLYNSTISEFLESSPQALLGLFVQNYHGITQTNTSEAWMSEIHIMQETLIPWKHENGQIIFEYDIPRLGKRIDVVVLLQGLIFCLEFKIGEKDILQSNIEQVLDYALDLKNFHLLSQDRTIVPILVPSKLKSSSMEFIPSVYDDSIYNPLITGADGLQELIAGVLRHSNAQADDTLNANWIISPYSPTPTIIEAARTLYENHSVEDITRHEADKVSTDATINYILDVIRHSKADGEKSICFVTGVPGAGKTLVGLDVAVKQSYQNGDKLVDDEGAVYLSGNGPLVAVLTEALAIDDNNKCKLRGEKKNMSDSRREVGKFIQIIHRYRDNMLAKIKNPVENNTLEIDPDKALKRKNAGYGEVEHVAIFDEAQRSWTHKRLSDYLKRGGTYGNKLKVPNFPYSEAAFLIWSLDQREDWATIVCLVGGGQEINTGENGGMVQWYNAIARSDKSWSVVCPDKLAEVFEGADVQTYDDLDLKVSIRSHTAGEVSNFVNKFIAGELDEAAALVEKIPQQDFHMYYTRDLSRAKSYCRGKYDHQPEKRYGMIVSSKASGLSRLGMPQPVWASRAKMYPDGSGRRLQVAPWFNKESNHPDSCCALTVAVTEFDCQGLEIDMPIIGWGEDAKWIDGHWNFKGTDDEKVTYRNNSYRVLLTRGREGFIVYIPEGRDEIAAIFERVGIKELKD